MKIFKRWFNKAKVNTENDDCVTLTITLNKKDNTPKVDVWFDEGYEGKLAFLLFEISEGYYLEDINNSLQRTCDPETMNKIVTNFSQCKNSKEGLEEIFAGPLMIQEQPFVSPTQVFTGNLQNETNGN